MADSEKVDYERLSISQLEARSAELQAKVADLRAEQRRLTPVLDLRREEAKVSKQLGRPVRLVPAPAEGEGSVGTPRAEG